MIRAGNPRFDISEAIEKYTLNAHENLNHRLKAAQQERYISPERPYSDYSFLRGGPHTYFFDFSNHSLFDFSSRHTVVHSSPEKSEAEKKSDEAKTAKLIGAIVVIAFSFIAGYFYCSWEGHKETYDTCQKHLDSANRINLPQNEGIAGDSTKNKIINFLNTQQNIHFRSYGWARNNLIAAGITLLGGSALLVGGVYTSGMLISAGYIATVAGLAFLALNQGLHWNDTAKNKKDWQTLISIAETPGNLLTQLHNHPLEEVVEGDIVAVQNKGRDAEETEEEEQEEGQQYQYVQEEGLYVSPFEPSAPYLNA